MGHQGFKTGGRQKGSRNKSKIAREEAAAKMVALVGEVIPDALPVTRTPSLCQGPAGAANGLEESDQPLNADHTKIYHNINYILLNATKLD